MNAKHNPRSATNLAQASFASRRNAMAVRPANLRM